MSLYVDAILFVLVLAVILGLVAAYYYFIKCVQDKSGGTICSRDCECLGIGKCALESADPAAKNVCCSVGTTVVNSKTYCTALENGKPCLSSDMCSGGFCSAGICATIPPPLQLVGGGGSGGNNPPAQPGLRPLSGSGTFCTTNADCITAGEICGRTTMDVTTPGLPQICCLSATATRNGNSLVCANIEGGGACDPYNPAGCASGDCAATLIPNVYACKGLPDGKPCLRHTDCLGGLCNFTSAAFGICATTPGGGQLAPAGSPCLYNSQCQNNVCGRANADTLNFICCLGNSINGNILFPGFCNGMPNGSSCHVDSECASTNCAGNSGGLFGITGICR